MPNLCLHHHDADGRASAAIVRRALGLDTLFHEMTYGDPLPWSLLEEVDQVIMVDFSFPRPEMERLAQGWQFTWIDHHISAIQNLQDVSSSWPGLRDTHEAACVLTWQFYFPEQPLPRAILLIGDRDIWRMAEADSRAFSEGLRQERTRPDNDQLWVPLLEDDAQFVRRLIERGKILTVAHLRILRRFVAQFGIPVLFEGYHTLAVNHTGEGDLGEIIRNQGYEIAYCYVDGLQNGQLMTSVVMFSRQADVSKIAQKFGGGGHRNAAGFSFKRGSSPFPPDADVVYQV